jgi:hypothetical protein
MRDRLATTLFCLVLVAVCIAQDDLAIPIKGHRAHPKAEAAGTTHKVSPSDTVVDLTEGTVLLCCRPIFPDVQNGWFNGPGYSLTQVFTDDGVGPGLVDCASCTIDPNIQPGFLLMTMPPPGSFNVNGPQFGWDGYIQFFATSVTADFSNPLLLTLSGSASASGTYLECTPPGQLCFETGLDFQILDQGQWKFIAHFIPDAGTPGNYDFRDVKVTSFNPVPFLDQPLVPAVVNPGVGDFTLTINGAGFVEGSTVNWNGVPKPTQFISSSQMSATIFGPDVSNIGTALVSVFTPAPGGGQSNVVPFPITNSTRSVAFATTTFPAGTQPLSIAAADFNSDGNLDLAVTLDAASLSVAVLIGNGNGSFGSPVLYTAGNAPFQVLATDVNHDGTIDLITANEGSDTVSILLGKGDGTFQSQTSYAAGSGPVSLIEGDFNQDGNVDLSVVDTNAGNSPGTVAILLGNGDGTFQQPLLFGTGQQPFEVTTGDFNGDDILDLAIAFVKNSGVSILLGNGDGSFQTHVDYFGPPNSVFQSIVSADFNGDRKLDLAVAAGDLPVVSILIGNGDGTFQASIQYNAGTEFGPGFLRTADLNGDSYLDLALVSVNAGLLLGNGDGSFGQYTSYSQTNGFRGALGDFNHDGRIDFAVANLNGNTVSILLQAPSTSFAPPSLPFGNQPVGSSSPPILTVLTNTGSAQLNINSIDITGSQAGEFSQTNNCPGNLAGGETCSVSVIFSPIATGLRTAALSFTDNASGSPQSVALSGTGTAPAATLSPASLTFASQLVGSTSPPQNLTLTNTGTATLVVSSIVPTGDFTRTAACGSGIPPGGSCTISVRFKPTGIGPRSGTLTVTDNATDSPQTVPLAGVGTVVKLNPTSLTFPVQVIGTQSAAQSVTFTNAGTVTLNLGNIKIAGTNAADFSRTTTCGHTLAAGASCTISVKFKPTDKDTRTATLSISDDGGGSPQLVSLSGSGTAVQLAPPSLNFGNVPVGHQSAPQTVTLTNVGPTTIHVSKISVTGNNAGDFFQSSSCRAPIAPGAACSIVVRFLPTAQGARTATVSIADDGGGSPQAIPVLGNGT